MNTAVGLMEMRYVSLYNIIHLLGQYKDDKVTKYGFVSKAVSMNKIRSAYKIFFVRSTL